MMKAANREFLILISLPGDYAFQKNVFFRKAKLLFLLLFILSPGYVNCETFHAGSDTWAPFFMVSNNQFSGIGVDILTEVAHRTGDKLDLQHLPNVRALSMFDNKEIDMIVIDSPLWNDQNKLKDVVFSDEVMSVQEYIYFLKDEYIEVETPEDLRGKVVNIFLGYSYPTFEKAFNKGIVEKDEVGNELSLIKILVAKRCTAIFMDSIAFKYNASRLGYEKNLFKRGMQLSDTELKIKIRREKASLLPRINKAIAEMKRDGAIERIIKKYTE
jgi:ABC-type amino acid transport substrate-binding protein